MQNAALRITERLLRCVTSRKI